MKLFLRKVGWEDMDLLYQWVNEPEVRENAFHTETIPYEAHKKWFHHLMEDDNQILYILILDNNPIGQIRITICGDYAEIDYSITQEKRGLGYGKEMIKLLVDTVCTHHPAIIKLIAKVKPSNTVSAYCFEKNNFQETYRHYELLINEV